MKSVKKFPYEIVESDYHGGAHIAFTETLVAGVRHINRLEPKGCQHGTCLCGGLRIVHVGGDPLTEAEEIHKMDIEDIERMKREL